MAIPGLGGPTGTKPQQRALPEEQAEQATTVMMDQLNFEATRPVSADPAVALAEALGQLPKAPAKAPRTEAKTSEVKTASVEALAQELGLKLGDQNELTIRRV